MSDAKFHLVARASILASGDTADLHHVAPDEVVLVSVEALERVTRERDEARADAALLRIALENAEPIEAERDLLRDEVERLRGALEDVSLWLSHWRHAIVIRAEGAAQAWDELERIHNKAASFSARGEVRK